MENFQDRSVWIRIRFVLPERLDPDPVCPEMLDPDPVNIRPDPQPCTDVPKCIVKFES